MNITETEHQEILRAIRSNLIELVGNDLGVYEVLNSAGKKIAEAPAIWAEPPNLPSNYRMKNNIEIIIRREVEIDPEPLMGNRYFYSSYYPVILRQYNLEKSLSPVVQQIIAYPGHNVLDFLITPYQETAEGIIRPTARFKICVARLV